MTAATHSADTMTLVAADCWACDREVRRMVLPGREWAWLQHWRCDDCDVGWDGHGRPVAR